jgi:hypothetical protein
MTLVLAIQFLGCWSYMYDANAAYSVVRSGSPPLLSSTVLSGCSFGGMGKAVDEAPSNQSPEWFEIRVSSTLWAKDDALE